jgi:hypothetical protein
MSSRLPTELLQTLFKQWPEARIHFSGLARHYEPTLSRIHIDVLRSPQLYSLEVLVCFGEYYGEELCFLKDHIIVASALKRFTVQVDEPLDLYYVDTPTYRCPHDIKLRSDDVMPALEEFTLVTNWYRLSKAHCQELRACADWSKLRKLDLGRDSPLNFLIALTGTVPNLKSFRFGCGYWWSHGRWPFSPPQNHDIQSFVDAIDGLEEMVVLADEEGIWSSIQSGFLEKHGPTLKRYHVAVSPSPLPSQSPLPALNQEMICKLAETSPGLEDLAFQLHLHKEGMEEWSPKTWVSHGSPKLLRVICDDTI